jgi:hypothetical protein
MSDRVRELAEREAALLLRSAAQRRAFAAEVHGIQARLHTVDRATAVARGALLHPAMIFGGLVALLVLGRTRTLHAIGRGLVLLTTGGRLFRIARGLKIAGALLPLVRRHAAAASPPPSNAGPP